MKNGKKKFQKFSLQKNFKIFLRIKLKKFEINFKKIKIKFLKNI